MSRPQHVEAVAKRLREWRLAVAKFRRVAVLGTARVPVPTKDDKEAGFDVPVHRHRDIHGGEQVTSVGEVQLWRSRLARLLPSLRPRSPGSLANSPRSKRRPIKQGVRCHCSTSRRSVGRCFHRRRCEVSRRHAAIRARTIRKRRCAHRCGSRAHWHGRRRRYVRNVTSWPARHDATDYSGGSAPARATRAGAWLRSCVRDGCRALRHSDMTHCTHLALSLFGASGGGGLVRSVPPTMKNTYSPRDATSPRQLRASVAGNFTGWVMS